MTQMLVVLSMIVLSVRMLAFQFSIAYCIMYFVMLKTVQEVPVLYFEMISDSKIAQVVHHMPTAVNKGKDINFSERSCYHKTARVLYRFFRFVYIAFVYYYLPYSIILFQWYAPGGDPLAEFDYSTPPGLPIRL